MKPGDVSQEAWDAAQSRALEVAATALRNLEQDDFAIEVHAIRCGIARAIDAAKAEEREEIAQLGDALADLFDGHAMRCVDTLAIIEARGAESAVRKYVDAIRGTPQ